MKKTIFLLLGFTVLLACKTSKKTVTGTINTVKEENTTAETFPYQASYTKIMDLVNTSLDVRFNWKDQTMSGKAVITMRPHFNAASRFWLNARGMTLNRVAQINGSDTTNVKYVYANDSIDIRLSRNYKKEENVIIYIDYISHPEDLKDIKGSEAITSNKGLYFINPLGKDPNKPKQIWTQGETQSNSVWYPTIDAPNQKQTQEIKITVDSIYVTLSNGRLIGSTNNGDGTRTDTWKQDLPHAPYLSMMAVGEFAIVKDKWKNKEVNYYVEPAYRDMASEIFGHTPEMIGFFSEKLGVDFAWDKYSQIVVRDYVSGAMENTSATLHGEFLQRNKRERVDETFEDVIAHELFHQWFGDLVTCESWSNIPLNESFATYGEYLWNEYKYGRDEADSKLNDDLNGYLREAKSKQVDLIRFHYNDREDMFDQHSYQKGGRVLHMLRKYVGDNAFFASLHLYLETNKFKPVEIHQLRLAFEEVTGEDLNWFFNQWFLDKGHPLLNIAYDWDEARKKAVVAIIQNQDLKNSPLYKIPMAVDFYYADSVERKQIVLDKEAQTFEFDCPVKPVLINADAEKMILCAKKEEHTNTEWMILYHRGKLYMDRLEAIQHLTPEVKQGTAESKVIIEALADKHYRLRNMAIKAVSEIAQGSDSSIIKNKLLAMAKNDPVGDVRNMALSSLDNYYSSQDFTALYAEKCNDSSYTVCGTALQLLASKDTSSALKTARNMIKTGDEKLLLSCGAVYAKYGNDNEFNQMQKMVERSTGYDKNRALQYFGKFLQHCSNQDNINKGIDLLYIKAKDESEWYNKLAAAQALVDLKKLYNKSAETTSANTDADKSRFRNNADHINSYLKQLAENEKDQFMTRYYNNIK